MSRWRKNKAAGAFSISPAFLLLLAVFGMMDQERLLVHILLAAALHECGHTAAVHLFGGEIAFFRITLFGGELCIRDSVRLSYGQELLAVLAGPGSNLVCALVLAQLASALGWERGYMIAGIHVTLAAFNLLPLRTLDGGRALFLICSFLTQPITADRAVHTVSFVCLTLLIAGCIVLQGIIGFQLPLLLCLVWAGGNWCLETGIVKPAETR